jgi:hypothetical protein
MVAATLARVCAVEELGSAGKRELRGSLLKNTLNVNSF